MRNNFQLRNAWEFIFSHIFAQLNCLSGCIPDLMHPDFVFIKTIIII